MVVIGQDGHELSSSRSLEDVQHIIPSFSVETQSAYNAVTVDGSEDGGWRIGFDLRFGDTSTTST